MTRLLNVIGLTTFLLVAAARADGPSDDLKKKPITTDTSEVGKLLTKWHKEGTAAGNVGDWYDNRDGEHSPLNLAPWPQLQKVKYSDDDIKARRHWALQPKTLPHVVFGNSSTSAPAEMSGSNPRTYYCSPQGLKILESHYLGNNLYIYPEHRDHDPSPPRRALRGMPKSSDYDAGHNGRGDGFGDLYPLNTPYLLISQGSSGSDQPFMRALPFTLAAFHPDVKKKLVENGLLMPTIQMVFRMSNKNVKAEKDYLTGVAHPTVFEGSNVDVLKMVKLAHDIQADSIPPLVKLKVTKEDTPELGKDYFEAVPLTEQHSDTACVIARIWRGSAQKRTLSISAADSIDLNKKPLTYTWVLLRGDEKRVKITPKDNGQSAQIEVSHHERRPIAPGSDMDSNRVDIGVFAHNGKHYSAPAFVTFFAFDSESRTYDETGRPIEIAYGLSDTEVRIAQPAKLFAKLSEEGIAAKMLGFTPEQRKELGAIAAIVELSEEELRELRTARKLAEATRASSAAALTLAENELERAKKLGDSAEAQKAFDQAKAKHTANDAAFKAANDKVVKAEKAQNETLDQRRAALADKGARPFTSAALHKLIASPTMWNDHAADLGPLFQAKDAVVVSAIKKVLNLGVAKPGKEGQLALTPARPGEEGKETERLSAYERATMEELNAIVLGRLVLPGLITHSNRVNYVDARLTATKAWRDVYRTDGSWVRYTATGTPAEFTPEGWLVVAKDDKGRHSQARTVTYKQDPPPKGTMWGNPSPLRHVAGEELITFEYEGDKRKIKSRDKVANDVGRQ